MASAQYGINILIGARMEGFKAALAEAEGGVKRFGGQAAAAFAGLSIGVGATLKAFADFESVIQEIAAVSGATTGELEQMKAAALALGAATKFSAKEAALGMAELTKAGFTASEAVKAIPGVLAAAAAGGTSVAQAAELAGGAIRGFGLAATDAGRVADVMAQAANKSAVGFSDLQLSLKYIAPVAAGTGQSLEGMAAAIAILGNNMIKADQAGTVIRASISALASPSKEAAGVIAQLGLSVADTTGRMLPFEQIIGQLRDRTAKLTEVQRANAIATIFGQEAMSGIMALVRTSPQDYAAMTQAMSSADGAAKDMADTMNRGLGPAFEQLMGSIETAGIQMGEQFAPAAKSVVTSVQGLVDAFTKLDPGIKGAIAGTVATATAFAGLVTGAGALAVAINAVRVAAVGLGASLGPVGWGITAVSLAAGVAVTKMGEQTRATNLSTDAAQRQARRIAELVAEHDRLREKTSLTTEEQARMAAILAELERISPAIVQGYNAQAQATEVNRGAVERLTSSLWAQVEAAQAAAQAERLATRETIARQRIQLQDKAKRLNELNRQRSDIRTAATGVPGVAGRPLIGGARESELPQLDAQADALGREIASERAGLDSAQGAYDQRRFSTGRQFGPQPRRTGPVAPTPRVVGGGGRAGGGGRTKDPRAAAEDAARKAEAAIAERVAKIGEGFERDLQRNRDDWKGGRGKDMAILGQWAAVLDASGLAKTKAGAAAVVKIHDQLRAKEREAAEEAKQRAEQLARVHDEQDRAVLEGVKKREAAEAQLRRVEIEKLPILQREKALIEDNHLVASQAATQTLADAYAEANALEAKGEGWKDTADAIRGAADAAFQASLAGANARRDLDFAEVAQKNAAAVRELQGHLMALATDPSLERIANFIRDIAQNPEAVQRTMDTAVEASRAAGGGWSGAQSAIGKIGGMLDPLAVGMTAIALVSKDIAAHWNDALEHAEALADLSIATAEMEADLEDDPAKKRDVAFGQIDRDRDAFIKKEKERIGFNDDVALAGWNPFRGENQAWLDEMTAAADRNAAVKKRLYDKRNSSDALTPEQLGGATFGGGRDATNYQELGESADAAADRIREAGEAQDYWTRGVERLAEIERELDEGARNESGKRISLEKRAELDIAKLKVDYDKKSADLKDRERKAQLDLLKIETDRAAAVQGVLDEGIAVRAKSEFQDKSERIAKINAAAQAAKTAKNEEIAKIKEQADEEQKAYDDRKTAIRAIADEKIAALKAEADAWRAQLEPLQARLDVELQLAVAIAKRRAAEGKNVQAYNAPDPALVDAWRSAAGIVSSSSGGTYKLQAFDVGGIIPGPAGAPVPILAHGREMMLNPDQQATLWRLANGHGAAPRASGGAVVNMGGIIVHGAPGQEPGAIARAVMDQLEVRLRRAGIGR